MEVLGFILIPVAIIELVIIYIFNFQILEKDYSIDNLRLSNRLLMEENKKLVEILEKRKNNGIKV